VIGGHNVLLPSGRYRHTYDPPIRWTPTGDREADIATVTQKLADMIEAWVRDAPEQWLWMHRRWKTQPAVTAAPAATVEDAPA
jgi:KDO2-lipid IV(A) lauroyltransferase